MTMPPPGDDALLHELRAAYDTAQPVHEGDREFALAAFAWRTIDADLAHAELVADSLNEPALVRRATIPGARFLAFEALSGSMEIEVAPGVLVGRLDPPEAGVITVRTADGAVRQASAAAGHFQLEEPPTGLARLSCDTPSLRIRTPWVRL